MKQSGLLQIRALNGSQNYAFEELCCQLVSLESRSSDDLFYRKGRGADAGVECFIRNADASEIGWQAKFFDKFGSSQISQLSESFDHAIHKHPKLNQYVVCLPIDLKDGRVGKSKTELQRWEDWRAARLKEMCDLGRPIQIVLWQATDLRERLFRHDAHYAGRLRFFFDETHFSNDWFRHQFTSVCEFLGERYTPQFHVSLPIRQTLLGISRDDRLNEQCAKWAAQLRRNFKSLPSTLQRANIDPSRYEPMAACVQELSNTLDQHYPPNVSYPIADWLSKIKSFKNYCHVCMEHCWTQEDTSGDKKDKEAVQSASRELSKQYQQLDDIEEVLSGDTWRLANEQAVLVYGEAGVGKSHLLADIVADVLKRNQPALLLINSQFYLQNPRTQILECLDLRNTDFKTLLGALDAAGQAAGVRALLMIDALNERHGIDLWREHLAPLISDIRCFSHLALIVSCRTTYLNYVVQPTSPLHNSLPRIEHHGFADGGGRAARQYLAQRKIIRPSAPNLLPEFNNPLFLKICCDSLDRHGLHEFPRGVQGLTQYFKFYFDALTSKVEDRMRLDSRQRVVARALQELTQRLLTTQSSYLPLTDAIVCFDAVHPSMGQRERSLLTELEHEGVLTVEPVYTDDNQKEEQVRFTFERFSDFQIAGYFLQQHMQGKHSVLPMEKATPLYEFLTRKDIYRFAGIVEALAVLLPEQTGVELPELSAGTTAPDWIVEAAFLKSLLLRQQDRFSDRTREFVLEFSTEYENHWLSTLISIGTEPDNKFNAYYLHDKLAQLSMPERDSKWSVPIATLEIEEGSSLDVLLSWVLEEGFSGIEPKRAELAAIMLTWLFSTSNRTIRDRATKALTSLLAPRLQLACSLIDRFRQVDDLYILERLLAASYGAALQAKSQNDLAMLVKVVYEWIFVSGKPPAHILLRDYARGIVEYTQHCGLLPSNIDIEKARPPYSSNWPIEYVGEEDLNGYTESRNGHTFKDDIVSSAGDGWLGDFGNKTISNAVGNWSATPLSEAKPLMASQCLKRFLGKISNEGQQRAIKELVDYCKACGKKKSDEEADIVPVSGDTPSPISIKFVSQTKEFHENRKIIEEKFKQLEKALLNTLDASDRYTYQVTVKRGLMGLMHGNSHSHFLERPETFDSILAQRWVAKRAHDLGWSSELFGQFDRRIGTGRSRQNKHIERIGKKYQWLALYELLARMADNLIYHTIYSDDSTEYDGPWQISERNIDPSLLIDKTQDDGWEKHGAVWWSPQALKLRHLSKEEQRIWLESDSEQLNSASLIDVTESENNQRWLVLKGFKSYNTPYDAGPHIDSWCRIWCVVVKKADRAKFVKAVSEQTLIDPHALPVAATLRHSFIGEYPWHPSCEMEDDWAALGRDYGYRGKLLTTVAEYEDESGGYDRSLVGNIRVYLPAPWLIKKLGLRLVDGHVMHYADHTGKILFKDPSIHEAGPSAALIDREAFLKLLQQEELAPVWIVAGEKGAYGEGDQDFVGRRVHSFVYVLGKNDEIECIKQNIKHEYPHN